MTSTATLIAEAKAALAAADAADERETDVRQLSSEARWLAAERMAELDQRGMGHREIAVALGVSTSTVDKYVSCVRKGAYARTQLFSDVLKQVRGGWGHEPASVEGKAKAVATFIKDDKVWNNPAVQAAASAAIKNQSRGQLPPPPVSAKPPPRGLVGADVSARADYWLKIIGQVMTCREELDKAIAEIRRSGLPADRAGQLVKHLRALATSVTKAEQVLADAAIGTPETKGRAS